MEHYCQNTALPHNIFKHKLSILAFISRYFKCLILIVLYYHSCLLTNDDGFAFCCKAATQRNKLTFVVDVSVDHMVLHVLINVLFIYTYTITNT